MSSYYVDEIDGVFFTDRTAATDEEFRSRIARFEAAPTPPEIVEARVVEEVARAICGARSEIPWDAQAGWQQRHYGRMAAAAVAAYRAAQDGGAEEALRRVEALCDVADDQPDGYECRFIATHVLRAALAPQAGDGGQ